MRLRHHRLAALAILVVSLSVAASRDARVVAQPPKKPVAGELVPQPLAIRPGDPLSVRTLVQRPPAIPGVLSWTIETRRHRGSLVTTALSPDGKRLATGGYDGIIRLWDAENGEFVRALVGHNSYVYGLAWSPDGNILASTGSHDGTAKLWDATTGLTLRTLAKGHKGYTHHVAWSRDGKSIVVAGGTSGFITVWDLDKPEPVKTSETGNPITGVAWGTDSRLVAVSGYVISVQVWDVREGSTVHTLAVPGMNGACVAWSVDGKSIAGGSATKTLVWDAETAKLRHELDTPGTAVRFNPAGDTLAVSSPTDVKLWSGAFDKPRIIPLPSTRSLLWSVDGAALFATAPTFVRSYTANDLKPIRDYGVAADFPVQLTPGRPLISGLSTVAPQLWDLATGKLVGRLEGHKGAVTSAAWSRDGKTLATTSTDKSARLWDAAAKPLHTLNGHDSAVRCVAWADGKTLATGANDKTVRVWDANTGMVKSTRQHRSPVAVVAWSKDGRQLASGDDGNFVLLGPPDNDKMLLTLTASAPVRSLAWTDHAKILAVGSSTGDVQLFAPVGGKLLHTFERGGSPPGVSSMAWAADGNTILTGRSNHTAQVWRIGAPTAAVDLRGMGPVVHVAWSPGGNSMILSEADRQARVFDTSNTQLRTSVIVDTDQAAIVSAAGHYRVADETTSELIYVVQTPKGQETLSPKEFLAKYKFKNNPAAVSLMDR